LHPNFRGVLYALWAREKDQRWLTATRKIIQNALKQGPGPCVFDLRLIDSDIALLKGDLEKGLSLRAQYLADHYQYDPSYAGGSSMDSWEKYSHNGERVPFAELKHVYSREIDYRWPRELIFYEILDDGGARQTEGRGPNEVLKVFYNYLRELYRKTSGSAGPQQAFYRDIHALYTQSSGDVYLKQAFMEAARLMTRGR
jgi:hypothetical protein